jgi:hypothetical protein
MIKASCFPSFAFGKNRLRSTARRSLLLAGANRKHDELRVAEMSRSSGDLESIE